MRTGILQSLKPWIVLGFAIAQFVASFLPFALNWESSIPERSMQFETAIVPITNTFTIWALIFLGSLAFAIYGFTKAGRSSALWHEVAWLAASVFALNTAWELYVPLRDLDIVSWLILALAAALAIMMAWRIAVWPKATTYSEKICIAVPMQIYAGWLSAATFVGIPSILRWSGVTFIDPQSNIVAITVLSVATMFAAGIIYATRSIPYTLTILWAFSGIVVANIVRLYNPYIAAAAVLAAVAILVFATFVRLSKNRSPQMQS